MAVDDTGALADHNAARKRDQHDVAGLGQIGGQPVGPDRFVEDILRDAVEHPGILGGKPDDLEILVFCALGHDGFVTIL
jgi:hypothetical protein